MWNPAMYTLGTAATAVGRSKATISRAIKKGLLSVRSKNENGSYSIDPAELHRLWAPVSSNGDANVDVKRYETPRNINVLEREIEFLEKRLAEVEADRDRSVLKAEQDRDRWHEMAKDAMMRIEAPRAKSWLARLFSS